MIKIAPSILSADFANLGRDIKSLEEGKADLVHIDVMDGIFVPNISFGVPVIKSIRNITKIPFDVHLMIEDPSRYIENFVDSGADIITFHYEAERHVDRVIDYIKSFGVKCGIALNPCTNVENLKYVINKLDMVLIMSVNPGFGGQKFIPYTIEKIKELRRISKDLNKDLLIEVDGGINTSNINQVVEAGANVIVAGSSVFNNGNIKENIKQLKEGV